MTNNTMVFYCNICNKNYKSKKSLQVHNYKYHSNKPQNNTFSPQNTTILTQNTTKKNKAGNTCRYCKKNFSRIDSMNRHMKLVSLN